MTQYKVDIQPPAKRLFLFVGDGLRADKLYQLYQDENDKEKLITLAPFLRDIVQNHGTWGISHTRVPTESRPGHVAIIAGFYEDVSAVTKVEFDSVFNQSRYTWSFGSPDILPMFAEGASDPNRVKTIMYGSESENFAEDASKLDTWVFEQFTQLLANSTTDLNLYNKLNDDQIVIFLHLLGLDSNGHAYGPHSKEYLNNIKVVDEGISKIVKTIEDFYGNDKRTSYIFTADHGMSNRGNHGDGHPDNTRTPIIAWGAGINKPNKLNPIGHDEFSKEWELDNIQRNDILQADIAPLMASLIGINYPVNSVGELPLGYLNNTPIFKAQSAFINAKEILEQYKVKYEYKKKTKLWFKEFPGLSNSTHNHEVMVQKIQNLINAEQYEEAEALCVILIKLSLEGLRYFQTYDWLMLRSIVTAGYLGWILYSLKFTLKEYAFEEKFIEKKVDSINVYINIITAISLILSIGLLYVQKSPGTYYTYVIFPVYFWREILLDKNIFFDAYKNSLNHKNSLFYIIGYILVLEVFVYSYFERSVLSFCFGLLAFWPLFISSEIRSQNVILFMSWFISCLASSVFTLLPVEKGEDITLLMTGGLLITTTGIIALWKKKSGLPFLNQIIAWMILVISTVTPSVFGFGFNIPQHHLQRLTIITLAFSPVFIILIAFFGTGNVASLASFSLQSVYRLTTIFDPFLMGGLLLFKIFIPFFIVSSVFGVINKSLNLPSFSLFLLVLSTCDIMTLNFFYLVRDYGSCEFLVGNVIIDGNERKIK
ncbi:11035_t:CDS:10 [Diversispora eburnea]|uniref:GPI ethanolamine phosphate transferase 1 n=1 Tax=Diversispora eburnea TaxID=1213867 RepID=A0A9N8UY99_9GLOM|nr:11035_t:CDS:10 [Diversispora eburnea]